MATDTSLALVDQALTTPEFKKVHATLAVFVKKQLRKADNIANGDSGDYGVIPFTKKMSLLKPGAEKLLKLFGFAADNQLMDKVEDWPGRFIMYRYKCTITHVASGKVIATATRTCNNKEKKHANKDVYDVANTIESVAQKRALVAATVQATMASEIFDADVSGDDDEAPHKTITQDDDPRRVKVVGHYFQSATDRGFTQEQAKAAAYRKLKVTSLTDATTNQIEDLTLELVATFRHVGEGNKPERITPVTEAASHPRLCPNPTDNPDCQGSIPDDDEHEVCSSCRMKDFIKSGKLSKGVAKDDVQQGVVLTDPI